MIQLCPSIYTRGVEAFLKKTAIAYHQNLAFLLGSRPYAIAVFFKNASTPRVLNSRRVSFSFLHGFIRHSPRIHMDWGCLFSDCAEFQYRFLSKEAWGG